MTCDLAIPVLRSFDTGKAKAFYCDFLGFSIEFEHRFEKNAPLYMELRRGACVLHLSEHHGDSCPGARLRIACPNLVEYIAELRAKNYPNARPGTPERMPWGLLETTITDPFGNRLSFYQP